MWNSTQNPAKVYYPLRLRCEFVSKPSTPTRDETPPPGRTNRIREFRSRHAFYKEGGGDGDEFEMYRSLERLPKRVKPTKWSPYRDQVKNHIEQHEHPILGKGHMTLPYAKYQGLVPEDTQSREFQQHIMDMLIRSKWGAWVGLERHPQLGHRMGGSRGPAPILWTTSAFENSRYFSTDKDTYDIRIEKEAIAAAAYFVKILKESTTFSTRPKGKRLNFFSAMKSLKVFDMKVVRTGRIGDRWLKTHVMPLLDFEWAFLNGEGWRR